MHAQRFARIGVLVGVTDTLCLIAAFTLAHTMRYGLGLPTIGEWLVVAMLVPVWAVTSSAWRLHQFYRFAPAEEFRRVVSAVSLCVVLMWTLSFWSHGYFSRKWVGMSWILAVLFVLTSRWLWHVWVAHRREHGDLRFRTVIVGTNEEGERLAALLESSREFDPVGFVWTGVGDPNLDGLPRVAELERLRDGSVALDADCLFVASSAVDRGAVSDLLRQARRQGVELRLSANLTDVLSTRLTVQPVGDVMTLSLGPVRLSGTQAALKRAFDLVVSAITLVVAAPLFAAIALAIRLETRGPVLFRQPRVTIRGRVFTLLKFRTMQDGAETIAHEAGVDTAVPYFKVEHDERVTRAGRWLRRTSLDELPQLWNVLIGDMSLVGPRPLPEDQVRAHEELLAPRHEVRAGLTGWWQIHGRSHLRLEDALRMDTFYIENWSFGLDLYILLKTIVVVARGEGAY